MKPILTWNEIAERITKCDRCSLFKERRNVVVGQLGDKSRHIVFLGEAPGFQEDVQAEPFVGKSGIRLMKAVKDALDLEREEYTILNSVKCRPPKNRQPTDFEKRCCRSYLLGQIANIGPCLIVALGVHACMTILKHEQKNREPLYKLRSIYFHDEKNEIIVLPTYHPAATLYEASKYSMFLEDLKSVEYGSFTTQRVRERFSLNFDEQEDLEGDDDLLSRIPDVPI